jgi:hypothetical protein
LAKSRSSLSSFLFCTTQEVLFHLSHLNSGRESDGVPERKVASRLSR